jgi:membrane protease YdiL (CAAX protease family)
MFNSAGNTRERENSERSLQIHWHAVGVSCLRLGLAFGSGFFLLGLLNRLPGFRSLSDISPWIPKYIADATAFFVGMIIIWRVSHGRQEDYGFTLKRKDLQIGASLFLGMSFGLLGFVFDHLGEVMSGARWEPAHPYSLALLNIVGMLSFQWIFVGIFEEPITRGLVQTYLLERLKGSVRIFRWNFHIGSVFTALIFGLGHMGPHLFFGRSWMSLVPHLFFATAYGLSSSYIYQQTRSLVGPIIMHNLTDGLIHSLDLLFY